MPSWDSVNDALDELVENKCSDAEARQQISQMAERNLLDWFTVDPHNGTARVLVSESAQMDGPESAPETGYFQQAIDAQHQRFIDAKRLGDEEGMERA